MIDSLQAVITYRGNVVRSRLARPATVARFLGQTQHLADYQVAYWSQRQVHRVTAEGFLTLYDAGQIPDPVSLKETTR